MKMQSRLSGMISKRLCFHSTWPADMLPTEDDDCDCKEGEGGLNGGEAGRQSIRRPCSHGGAAVGAVSSAVNGAVNSAVVSASEGVVAPVGAPVVGGTTATAIDTSLDATVDSTVDSTVDAALDSTVDSTVDSTIDSTVDTTVDATLDSTVDAALDSTADSNFSEMFGWDSPSPSFKHQVRPEAIREEAPKDPHTEEGAPEEEGKEGRGPKGPSQKALLALWSKVVSMGGSSSGGGVGRSPLGSRSNSRDSNSSSKCNSAVSSRSSTPTWGLRLHSNRGNNNNNNNLWASPASSPLTAQQQPSPAGAKGMPRRFLRSAEFKKSFTLPPERPPSKAPSLPPKSPTLPAGKTGVEGNDVSGRGEGKKSDVSPWALSGRWLEDADVDEWFDVEPRRGSLDQR